MLARPSRATCGLNAPQQTASLFDHLVGATEQREWHGDAERLGDFQVDVKLDFGCLLDRQVGP
jgi:hypothetical protein